METVVDGITDLVDSLVYWRGYRIAVVSGAGAPPCRTGEQLIAALAVKGEQANSPGGIECSGQWAAGPAQAGYPIPNEFTVVMQDVGGRWTVVDLRDSQFPGGSAWSGTAVFSLPWAASRRGSWDGDGRSRGCVRGCRPSTR